ncbi:His Kinase A (phospho-acceptor) domain-containing protein [Roseivivax lentus]|uniref:histidine kinase n=1 Tax=Roseivivax lentus TaxID=633194 RepID=A0A1N7PEG4_9RHOB|nr:HAMP domain-containing histidine kinase [Roseivivax lentus]SIT08936.1 His Kinase A (phospho-acceptor) domain-containing protein [Roseivivax lentus]
MRFTTKIAIAQAVLVLVAGAVAVLILTTLRTNQSVMREISDSYEQTLTVKGIEQMADNYSEQIAEHVILGPESEQAEKARDELLGVIETMERQVAAEIEELREVDDLEEIAEEQLELDRMTGLREAVLRLEEARLRLVHALQQGETARAIEIYSGEIEEVLDVTLDRLTEDSVAREQLEVREALADSQEAMHRLRWIAAGLGLASVLVAAGLSHFLNRSVLRPVARLGDGVAAVSGGDLDHRITVNRKDEFGDLAKGFNRMTAEIDTQRGALIAARNNLKREVDERTQELRDALRDLERQSKQRSRFLADISHELRTPLTVLRGRAEVALRDPETDQTAMRTVIERTVGTATKLGRLVEDLLFLARSEAGVIPIERGPVVLQDVLADTLLDSRELARSKRIALLPRQPAVPIEVTGDADRLRQALLILLDNAVEAAPEASTIQVTLSRDDATVIEVADEGPGFSEDEIAEPSVRFRKGRSRGTGLGLSIAAWIMEGHGGSLSVSNGSGGGGVVRLVLREDAP